MADISAMPVAANEDEIAPEDVLSAFDPYLAWERFVANTAERDAWTQMCELPRDARPWVTAGITSGIVARSWHRIEVAPDEAAQWITLGVLTGPDYSRNARRGLSHLDDVAVWQSFGVRAVPEMLEWLDAQVNIDNFVRYRRMGISTPAIAKRCISPGLMDSGIRRRMNAMFRGQHEFPAAPDRLHAQHVKGAVDQAAALFAVDPEATPSRTDRDYLQGWAQQGIVPTDILAFEQAGVTEPGWVEVASRTQLFTPRDVATAAGDWQDAEFTVTEAMAWSVVTVPEWRDEPQRRTRGRSPEVAAQWQTAGFTVTEANEWASLNVSVLRAMTWRDLGYTARGAALWATRRIPAETAHRWMTAYPPVHTDDGWELSRVRRGSVANLKAAGISSQWWPAWVAVGYTSSTQVFKAIARTKGDLPAGVSPPST